MPEPVVTPVTPAASAVAQPDATADLQKEIAALKAQVTEKDQAAQFWYGKANTAKEPAPKAAAAAEPEDDTDLLDLVATKGSKGMRDWMAKQGFVGRSEVDALVQNKAAQFAQEQTLLTAHPDLKDTNSQFFKDTAIVYHELKTQGVPEAVAMRLAAQQVAGTKKAAAADKTDKTEERRERGKAAAGDTGRGKGEAADDDELTPQQLSICKAMGVDPAKYAERAKAGIQMSLRHQ
jgi:hypothetical protein